MGSELKMSSAHISARGENAALSVTSMHDGSIEEQLSSTSKQFMPEYLELSGCHFRKVESYMLHPRGFLLVPVVRSLFYFIHTVKNKNVIKYSSKTPVSNAVIYLHFSLGSRVCSVNHAIDYYSYLHVR